MTNHEPTIMANENKTSAPKCNQENGTAGDVLLYLSSYGWVFPWEFLPWVGMSCVRRVCSFGGRVVCGLWWPGFCGRPLVGFRGCVASLVPICGGRFFLSLWM